VSAIDDYKKLRGEALALLLAFERVQDTIKLTAFADHVSRKDELAVLISEAVKSSAFRALFAARLNQQLAGAFAAAKCEAEAFASETGPVSLESLKLEGVRAVPMPEVTGEQR
jgi:hypothetical protein